MGKPFLTLLIISLFALTVNAQSYTGYMGQGKRYYKKRQYLTALERFDLAYEFAQNDKEKDQARNWKNKSRVKIRQQQDELKKTLALLNAEKDTSEYLMRIALKQKEVADIERKKAELALKLANLMQQKVGTAMFDIAVKEHSPKWKGFANTNEYERAAVLKKIDSLNFYGNALLLLPKEVTECANLKSINILQNQDIDWTDCFKKLSTLPLLTEIKISVYDFDSIPKQYRRKVTGIEILKKGLNEIPDNILAQKQLTYLDLSGKWNKKNNLSFFPGKFFNLKKLKYLNLTYCELESLPKQISKFKELSILILNDNKFKNLPTGITNIKELYLADNLFSMLQPEIGNYNKIQILDLSRNGLNELPPEIGKLKNIKIFLLESNNVKIIPDEIRYLSNLRELDISYNNLLKVEKQRIKKLLPNCKITF